MACFVSSFELTSRRTTNTKIQEAIQTQYYSVIIVMSKSDLEQFDRVKKPYQQLGNGKAWGTSWPGR